MKPCLRSIMSSYLPYKKQGELMGAITSINGLSLIIGPLIMTQTFSFFKTKHFNLDLIGAPFFLSMIFSIIASTLVISLFFQKKVTTQNVA